MRCLRTTAPTVPTWRSLPPRLACATRHADWPRTSWRAPYVLLLVSPCPPPPRRQLSRSVACLLAVCVRGSSNPSGGPRTPRRRSGHSPAAELVRSHQVPGTVSRFVLTVLDRVHGVGIVVGSTGLCFQPVCVRGVAARWFWRDGGFWRRFPGRDAGVGDQAVGLRRAAGRGVAGRDPGPRCGMLVGCLASLDAVESVGLVGERCPAGARAVCGCCG